VHPNSQSIRTSFGSGREPAAQLMAIQPAWASASGTTVRPARLDDGDGVFDQFFSAEGAGAGSTAMAAPVEHEPRCREANRGRSAKTGG
jgi:hypothetical protein